MSQWLRQHCEKLLSTSLFHFRTLQHVALGLFHMRERERRPRPPGRRGVFLTDENGGMPVPTHRLTSATVPQTILDEEAARRIVNRTLILFSNFETA